MAFDPEDDPNDDGSDPSHRANSKPDASVTAELFKAWRSPRSGRTNPERMNNPVWEWLIRTRLGAHWANEEFSPSSRAAGPCWCFLRFGQTKTRLPDGRMVLIGGEHEDHYDPDFCIYNDVVVRHPDGSIEIYGYPEGIFPPTDSHSATLAGDRIIVIGCLGYSEQRQVDNTPVYSLDLQNFAIGAVNCSGDAPGWLHKHHALHVPRENAIVITGGLVLRPYPDRQQLVENIDDWKLHLADLRWERMTRRRWQRWHVRRQDGRGNSLFWIRSACKFRRLPGPQIKAMFEEGMQRLNDELGFRPDLDFYEQLYVPPVPHATIPDNEGEFAVRRIDVDGVIVRYNEDSYAILVTIEGDLPTAIADSIVADVVDKVSALERAPYEIIPL